MNDSVPTQGGSEGARLPALMLPPAIRAVSVSDMKEIAVDAGTDLPGLAQAVNDAHAHVEHHGRRIIESAVHAGKVLIEAKAAVGHGGFKQWVEANCRCSYRSARRYMQVAKIASEELANPSHFDDGVSAFLAKHSTTERTKTVNPRPQKRETEPTKVNQSSTDVVEANDVALEAAESPPTPQPEPPAAPPEVRRQIMTLSLNTVRNVEAVLVEATHVQDVSLELGDPEMFKAREAIIMQLSSIQHDDLLELLASILLKVGIACSASA